MERVGTPAALIARSISSLVRGSPGVTLSSALGISGGVDGAESEDECASSEADGVDAAELEDGDSTSEDGGADNTELELDDMALSGSKELLALDELPLVAKEAILLDESLFELSLLGIDGSRDLSRESKSRERSYDRYCATRSNSAVTVSSWDTFV
jgi:hypothetical protein